MTETFLVLLAAGVMLAAVISDPKQVTLLWLRLAGIIALAAGGLSAYFLFRREGARPAGALILYGVAAAGLLGQLAFVQMGRRSMQRAFAVVAVAAAVGVGATLMAGPVPLREPGGGEAALADKLPGAPAAGSTGMSMDGVGMFWRWGVPLLASSGIAAMVGLVLMDMLLGHAYLTASRMTNRPFLRLNRALAVVAVMRAICAAGVTMILLPQHPIELFWGRFGILIFTRWLVGLLVPGLFIYMAHDCIKRRSTQSATGILYVAGVLIFIGEIMAMNLVMETGLPF